MVVEQFQWQCIVVVGFELVFVWVMDECCIGDFFFLVLVVVEEVVVQLFDEFVQC